MIKNTDLAYAAGYIDGDGCFYIGKSLRKFISHLIVISTDKEILLWFKKLFRGNISSAKIVNATHKPVYHFNQKKKDGTIFTKNIIHYLVEKQEEAKLFIAFSESTDVQERMSFIEKMKSIKHFTNLVSKDHKSEFEAIRSAIIPTKEDFAYLAGFIDAECSLGIIKDKAKNKPNHTYKIMLQCNNTKHPIFKWLLQRFGGTINFIDRKIHNSDHRNQLHWRISSAALANILTEIHPFLKYKKPVCEELIKFTKTVLPNGGARHTEKFRSHYSKILEERECIVHKVHLLNLKGINI